MSIHSHLFEQLFSRRANHITPGIERIRAAWLHLEKPAAKAINILVGGTNGKGTTSSYLWRLLNASGVHAGLYTSPHLQSLNERFVVSGKIFTDSDIAREWERLKSDIPDQLYEPLSFFEISTLIAFRLFECERTHINIIEVGMGGSFDATNVIEPSISILVSVDYDHQQYLGTDLKKIAEEKLGITRKGKKFLIGKEEKFQFGGALSEVLESKIERSDLQALIYGREFFWVEQGGCANIFGQQCDLSSFVASEAHYLQDNFLLAVAAYQCIRQGFSSDIRRLLPLPTVSEFERERPPSTRGRFEYLHIQGESCPLLVDVAHNPHGLRALIANLRAQNEPKPSHAFVSILVDKDITAMLDILTSEFENVCLFGCSNERGMKAEDIPPKYQNLNFFENFRTAWNFYKKLKKYSSNPPLLCGSIAAIGEVFDLFGLDQQTLRFESKLSGVLASEDA